MEEHLFRWDKIKWEEITEKDKKRIREFIIHNYDPKLSPTAKIEKVEEKTIKIADERSIVYLTLESDKGKMDVKIAEKTDELILKKDTDNKDGKEFIVHSTNTVQGPGDRFVGSTGIILTLIYLLLVSAIIIYSLVKFWPAEESSVTEKTLLLLVVFSGALGSLVHALRSFYWYVGNRELVLSWLIMYILLPVSGSMLALIFYIGIRGGLFPEAGAQETSVFGFVAISALVGLFSVQAALKLQEVAETVFTKAGKGRESKPQVSEGDTCENN